MLTIEELTAYFQYHQAGTPQGCKTAELVRLIDTLGLAFASNNRQVIASSLMAGRPTYVIQAELAPEPVVQRTWPVLATAERHAIPA
ncbi:hypothetical protein [Deinococcus sonorensis]|uniref:DUF4224 domain-containing protein n=2 Tax=Deinococcus sonorensis TaxID=309891 RepID=A0AAU7UC88_9DEIO